jgi:hypothetical protein
VGASAQYGLGWFYELGKGVLQSHANAEKWYLLPNCLEEINKQEFIKISTKNLPVTSRKLVNSGLQLDFTLCEYQYDTCNLLG